MDLLKLLTINKNIIIKNKNIFEICNDIIDIPNECTINKFNIKNISDKIIIDITKKDDTKLILNCNIPLLNNSNEIILENGNNIINLTPDIIKEHFISFKLIYDNLLIGE